MKKLGFITVLTMAVMTSSSAVAQNYYDPGYFQNNTQGYANYNYGYQQRYSYPQNYAYQQNYAYTQQSNPNIQNNRQQLVDNQRNAKKQRGVGTMSIGADYVLGYTSFVNEDYKLNTFITGSPDFEYTTRDFDRQSNAIGANLGWRPFKHIGIEAFYISSLKSSSSENLLSATGWPGFETLEKETSYRAYGVDLIGYYQVNEFIELLASIGVGKYDYEADITISYRDLGVNPTVINRTSQNFEDSVMAYRIGGGFQLWISKHIAFRLTGRWTRLGGDLADYITEINAGVRYHF